MSLIAPKSVELLAPARDLECGRAAVDAGADAVYIGAPRWSARESAGNSLSDLAALTEYAHKYWARIYVALNTLLFDHEIPEALDLIDELHGIGIDGLIVQDTGLLECDLPPLPLIASTQMHNHTPERAAFLEQVGFQRIILARELDLDQVKAIRAATGVELEYFIHGALCVSHSGQCYLSQAWGGRSGNRGNCAQPCRRSYELTDTEGRSLGRRHFLSLKDLGLAGHLDALLDAGVTSFKIEGRLKDRIYVANVVGHYRKELDRLLAARGLARSSSGSSLPGVEPDLEKTFNRGYTTYYLHGRTGPVGALQTPKMVGETIGQVIKTDGRNISLNRKADLNPGDGLCYFDLEGRLTGTVVNAAQGRGFSPQKPDGFYVGAMIYRNRDHVFLNRAAKNGPTRSIGVEITLETRENRLTLTARDEDGVSATLPLESDFERADQPDRALANIRKQLAKTGATEFICAKVTIRTEPVPFMPVSVLNDSRRSLLERLARERIKARPASKGGPIRNDVPFPEKDLPFSGNVLNQKAEAFYRRHGVETMEPAAESGLDLRGRRVMTTRYCLRYELDRCPKSSREDKKATPFYLEDESGRRLELKFDCRRCGMDIYWME